ncbi:HAUS augmin-like complex subunit 1 isoform X2 [Polypterus senegalus]|uniref:HAUS augmin-like complex subunit 1 isoform X2 n=1 Tax=Polypterus senegalus TaxID=55291 RepID=UPI0019662BCF|nr:HAUS augmin-like complex subunit 1 isoform X2 [Polypterus senegalus]
MSEKTIKVSKWLSSLFGNKPVPVYEVNTRTTDILYELAECSESRCEDISLLIEDLKQKSTEYNVEGSYNHELLLEAVGLSSNILSKTALSCLNALEGTTVALSAKDTSLCSLMAAMDDLTNEVCATERKNQELDQQLTLLKKQMTAALVLHRSLQEDLGKTEDAQAVEMAKAENRLQNMDFLKAKSTDLIHRIRSCEKLNTSGMDNSLSHQALLNLSEKLTTLKQENTSLKKKLDSYMDLTPNPSLAQVKIEEAKRELASIDADLTVKVDMMEMFLPEQHKRSMF